jgi:hypothetical protein
MEFVVPCGETEVLLPSIDLQSRVQEMDRSDFKD